MDDPSHAWATMVPSVVCTISNGMKNGQSWLTSLSRPAVGKNLVFGCFSAHSDG